MSKKKSVVREYYEAILVAFILALFVRTFVFENFKIPSGSMEDNLLVGDHLVVNKFIFGDHVPTPVHKFFGYREPRAGRRGGLQVPRTSRGGTSSSAASRSPVTRWRSRQEAPHQRRTTGRALCGIQGRPVGAQAGACRVDNYGPRVVPEGTIFCLGDNRDNSLDSRFWGPVPLSYVKGRAVLIYWSYEAKRNDWEWRGVSLPHETARRGLRQLLYQDEVEQDLPTHRVMTGAGIIRDG